MAAKVKRVTRISRKNQVTIPVDILHEAGIKPGDEVEVRVSGHGQIAVEREPSWLKEFAGSMPGVWEPGEIQRLRREWDP